MSVETGLVVRIISSIMMFPSNAIKKISAIFSTQRERYPSKMTVDEARKHPKKYSGMFSHIPLTYLSPY